MGMTRPSPMAWMILAGAGILAAGLPRAAGSGTAEIRIDRDFLAALVEKLPPRPFHKDDRHRGTVHDCRLVAIDPATRRFLVTCQVDGEFRPPVNGPISEAIARGQQSTPGWRTFRFDIKAGINIEPGGDGVPRLGVHVDEIKRRELDGLAGTLAALLGKNFDELVTGIADGKADSLGAKLNADLRKRLALFRQFALAGIDYAADHVAVRFELATVEAEGVAAYVFAGPHPGAVPVYGWAHPRLGTHVYTLSPVVPGRVGYRNEGIACYAFDHAEPGSVPYYRWHNARDYLFLASADGEGAARQGHKPEGIAFYAFATPQPGTAPLYRLFDPRRGLHAYTLHPPGGSVK